MPELSQGSREARTFDAIDVGSGIAGGWAAKELSEKGLKTLVLERGRKVEHVKDYTTFDKNPWDFRFPGGRTPQAEIDKHYFKQQRTGYTVNDGDSVGLQEVPGYGPAVIVIEQMTVLPYLRRGDRYRRQVSSLNAPRDETSRSQRHSPAL